MQKLVEKPKESSRHDTTKITESSAVGGKEGLCHGLLLWFISLVFVCLFKWLSDYSVFTRHIGLLGGYLGLRTGISASGWWLETSRLSLLVLSYPEQWMEGNICWAIDTSYFILTLQCFFEEGLIADSQMRHLKLRAAHLPGVSFCSSY